MFNTRIITHTVEFESLRDEWNDLLMQNQTNTIFLTWEWLYSWWMVFGQGAELFIITVRDALGKLLGIGPLFIRRSRYYKFPVREMTFIGIGHSDRQDFISLESGSEIIKEILSVIYKNMNRWDIVNLDQIPSDTILGENVTAGDLSPNIEYSTTCPFLQIDDDWDQYFKTLNRKFRYDIRNKSKRLRKAGEYKFKMLRTASDPDILIKLMNNIERKSEKYNTGKAFYSYKDNRHFLSLILKVCIENNWLAFTTLSINGRVLAYSLGYIYNHRHYGYSTAYDIEFKKYSPGKLVINETIKWFFENNNVINTFDFVRGDTSIKSKWASEKIEHVRVVYFKKGLYTNMIRFLVFNVRPIIKKIWDKYR